MKYVITRYVEILYVKMPMVSSIPKAAKTYLNTGIRVRGQLGVLIAAYCA